MCRDLDKATHTIMALYFAILLALGACAYAADGECVLAQTDAGAVCGARLTATDGAAFVSFLGIRYAKPPLGELRFAEPQLPDPIVGVFNATVPGPMCPQTTNELGIPIDPRVTSEDCLRINVHVPLSAMPEHGVNKPLRKVMVYAHGGSFIVGSGNPDIYGPEYLMTQDVILVTFNYRINSIGFLSLCSKYVPGNAGLRDTIFALKWVRRNILNFGGDPEEVTLAGQSAGAAVAHLVSMSPAVIGMKLMKRLLILSGSGIANFFTSSQAFARITSQLFLTGMGISSFQSQKQIHKRLSEATIEEIMKGNQYVRNKTGAALTFTPVVECPLQGIETIIPKDPELLLREGYGKEYPALFGFTNNEAQVFRIPFEKANLEKTVRTLPFLIVPQNILFASNVLTVPAMMVMVSNEYFNNTFPTVNKYLSLATDSFYKYPALRIAERRRTTGAAPTCIYEFGYPGVYSPLKLFMKSNWTGAGHSEDLTYFFRINTFLGPAAGDELAQPDPDSRMKLWMTTYISDFMKNGCPSSPIHSCVSGSELEMLKIGGPAEQSCGPPYPYLADKKRFFDKLYRVGRMEIFKG